MDPLTRSPSQGRAQAPPLLTLGLAPSGSYAAIHPVARFAVKTLGPGSLRLNPGQERHNRQRRTPTRHAGPERQTLASARRANPSDADWQDWTTNRQRDSQAPALGFPPPSGPTPRANRRRHCTGLSPALREDCATPCATPLHKCREPRHASGRLSRPSIGQQIRKRIRWPSC